MDEISIGDSKTDKKKKTSKKDRSEKKAKKEAEAKRKAAEQEAAAKRAELERKQQQQLSRKRIDTDLDGDLDEEESANHANPMLGSLFLLSFLVAGALHSSYITVLTRFYVVDFSIVFPCMYPLIQKARACACAWLVHV